MKNLIAVIDKWPDCVELRQDEGDVVQEWTFIVKRRNSYPINPELKMLLHALEDHNFNVRIRIGNVDITLEQFEQRGAWAAGGVSKTASNRQGFYNLRSQLNKMQEEAQKISEDSPQYALYVRRISHLRTMLETIEPDVPVSQEMLNKSGEALKHLEQLIKEASNGTSKPTNASQGEDKTNEAQRDVVDSAG